MTNTTQMQIIARMRAIQDLRTAYESDLLSWETFMKARQPIVEEIEKLQENA